MSIADKKFEMFIAAFALLFVWGVSSLMKNWSSPVSFGADVVYEMPRPKNFKGTEFDLSDREIDRRFVNPFEKKKAEEAKAQAQAKGSAEKNAIAAKASAEAAKKVEAARKAEADRKAKVTARIIERDKQAALAAEKARQTQAQQQQQVMAQVSATATAQAQQANETKKDDGKRSPDQWRALVLAQPTKANIDLMYAAVVKGDLEQSTYFNITTELLTSQKSETQAVGLYASAKAGNSKAFEVVVKHEVNLNADVKVNLEKEFYDTYRQVSRFNALASSLQSNEKAVVMQALDVVNKIKAKGVTGTVTQTPGQVSTLSTAYNKAFDTILQNLMKSNDQDIRTLAGTAQMPNSPTTVAANP